MQEKLLLSFLAKIGKLCNPINAESISNAMDASHLRSLQNRLSQDGYIEVINYPRGYTATKITDTGRAYLLRI